MRNPWTSAFRVEKVEGTKRTVVRSLIGRYFFRPQQPICNCFRRSAVGVISSSKTGDDATTPLLLLCIFMSQILQADISVLLYLRHTKAPQSAAYSNPCVESSNLPIFGNDLRVFGVLPSCVP